MTETDIIDGVLQREGGWRDETPRPNAPPDPATNFGITLPALQAWRRRVDPQHTSTIADLRLLDRETAAEIYEEEYILEPGFTTANIPFEALRVQLIDYGINSDPERALRWLQRVLGLQPTGFLNKQTLDTFADLMRFDTIDGVVVWRLINDALVAARCHMITAAVAAGHIRKEDERGLLERAISFTLTRSS